MSTPLIDMWAPIVPTREIMDHVADNFPEAQLGYLRIFQKRPPAPPEAAHQASVDSDSIPCA